MSQLYVECTNTGKSRQSIQINIRWQNVGLTWTIDISELGPKLDFVPSLSLSPLWSEFNDYHNLSTYIKLINTLVYIYIDCSYFSRASTLDMALNSVNQPTCVQRNQKIIKTKRSTSFPSESPARSLISYAERCVNDGVRSRGCFVENVDVVRRRNFVLPAPATIHRHYHELNWQTTSLALLSSPDEWASIKPRSALVSWRASEHQASLRSRLLTSERAYIKPRFALVSWRMSERASTSLASLSSPDERPSINKPRFALVSWRATEPQ